MKGKVNQVTKQKSSENKTGTKSSAPAVKKNLTVETDNFGATEKESKKEQLNSNTEAKEKDEILDKDDFEEEDDDDLARDEDTSPMDR